MITTPKIWPMACASAILLAGCMMGGTPSPGAPHPKPRTHDVQAEPERTGRARNGRLRSLALLRSLLSRRSAHGAASGRRVVSDGMSAATGSGLNDALVLACHRLRVKKERQLVADYAMTLSRPSTFAQYNARSARNMASRKSVSPGSICDSPTLIVQCGTPSL